jgi:predicted tellurium resistance membrane protein TerC
MIDLVFSFDSILTAGGMTNGVEGALYIMITAGDFSSYHDAVCCSSR